mmetsp:Transcript_53/g.80  ORF Transcript_53/g.80 Transcript_53/m.80 type:complete len:158 (+) Transcript_53:108-581(+)
MKSFAFIILLLHNASAFTPYSCNTSIIRPSLVSLNEMKKIAEGVEFDTIAREWRCKFSSDGDKASLVACQMALESVAEDLLQVDGVKSVERVVCGDCLDFKVITSVDADRFGEWKKEKFDPEEDFLEMVGVIDGISQIETQTYTKMPVMVTDFLDED